MPISTQLRQQLADARRLMQDGGAGAALQQAVRLARDQPTHEVLVLLGECHLEMGEAKQAVVPLAAATGLSDHPRPASLLARALIEIGRKDDALLICQRLLRRDPKNRDALNIMQRARG